jgi:hypothetical protein
MFMNHAQSVPYNPITRSMLNYYQLFKKYNLHYYLKMHFTMKIMEKITVTISGLDFKLLSLHSIDFH